MKNRKNTFVLAIVALILVLGVGYAVVSASNLTINGTAAAKATEIDVVYTGVNSGTTSGTTGHVTSITNPADTKNATFAVADLVYNETVSMDFEITNKESDLNATIGYPTATVTNSDYFEVTYGYADGACGTVTDGACSNTPAAWASGTKTLAANNAKAVIRVNVRLKKSPISNETNSSTITITYTATPAAA